MNFYFTLLVEVFGLYTWLGLAMGLARHNVCLLTCLIMQFATEQQVISSITGVMRLGRLTLWPQLAKYMLAMQRQLST